ncbi:hypothetical protein OAL01_01225 [Rubripirellula sp.]|nr:hypothetical protein [Rubripirellula sp.]
MSKHKLVAMRQSVRGVRMAIRSIVVRISYVLLVGVLTARGDLSATNVM